MHVGKGGITARWVLGDGTRLLSQARGASLGLKNIKDWDKKGGGGGIGGGLGVGGRVRGVLAWMASVSHGSVEEICNRVQGLFQFNGIRRTAKVFYKKQSRETKEEFSVAG